MNIAFEVTGRGYEYAFPKIFVNEMCSVNQVDIFPKKFFITLAS